MSREFCLKAKKKEELIGIILQQDKMIDNFNKDCTNDLLMRDVAGLQKQLADAKSACDYHMKRANDLLVNQNQDKISFAVKQLEKVKEYNSKLVFSNSVTDKYIDDLIYELKEKN